MQGSGRVNTCEVMVMVFGEDYEWWHPGGEKVVRSAARKLLEHGLSRDDAADVIGMVVGAIQNEYGA